MTHIKKKNEATLECSWRVIPLKSKIKIIVISHITMVIFSLRLGLVLNTLNAPIR